MVLAASARHPPVPASAAVWRSVRAHGDTKTEKSRRTLELPTQAAEALHTHHVRQARERLAAGKRWQDHGLVFASQAGTPPSSKTGATRPCSRRMRA